MGVHILSFNMGEKKFVLYPIPAVIIAAGELTLNFYERSKVHTALPAPVAIEYDHIVDGMLAGEVIKERGVDGPDSVKKREQLIYEIDLIFLIFLKSIKMLEILHYSEDLHAQKDDG